MKASEFLKRYEQERKEEEKQAQDGEVPEEDHSLQAQAKERASHPEKFNAGTAHDWEDMDRWQKELKRLDREGPGRNGDGR